MRRHRLGRRFAVAALLASGCASGPPQTRDTPIYAEAETGSGVSMRIVTFDDLKPRGAEIKECWGGIGIDHDMRIYAAFSDTGGENADDTVIFRYDTITAERELLGTLRGISATANNAKTGETFAKVHVAFLEHQGKMYFASHDFHAIERDYSDMTEHRGGHFYAYDLTSGAFEDLSKSDPGGVSVPHQGIIATDILRAQDKLAGFTFPLGDIVIYDLKARRSQIFPGVSKYRRKNVTRYIIATPKGKVLFAYQVNDFWLWELDIETGEMRRTPRKNIIRRGGITATVTTRDARTVYLTDLSGRLYRFDVDSEALSELGFVLTPAELDDGKRVRRLGTIALSKDETKLYTMPYGFKDGSPPALYEYDIASGRAAKLRSLASFPQATVKGAGVTDDRGRIYFCMHEEDRTSARLIQITL